MKKVLLCDDQKILRTVLRESILQLRDDIELVEAEDGLGFLDRMEELDIDLAFLDVEMPNLDGFQALQKLRARESSEGRTRSKVVMVTAMVGEDNVVRGWELEADGYISKPYDVDEIREALDQHLPDSIPS